jgi:hypothetical protein
MHPRRRLQIESAIEKYFRWSTLYDMGNSRLLRTSYVWLIVVPIAAKLLVGVNELLTFSVYGQEFQIEPGLPFSWKAFYFSSVSFSVAGLIYSFRCEGLAKHFRTFADYENEGRGVRQLMIPARIHGDQAGGDAVDIFIDAAQTGEPVCREVQADAFWALRYVQDKLRPWSLGTCSLFYLIGFGLLAMVLLQNFWYVLRATV